MATRILVNALSARLGGGQTYIRNLLQNIPEELDVEIMLLVPTSLKFDVLSEKVSVVPSPFLDNPIRRALWEYRSLNKLLSELNVDIYFSPGGMLPRGLTKEIKTVVTFQNMLPFSHEQRSRYPLGYRRIRDWLLERAFKCSMQQADLTIFISQYAKQFIGKLIDFPKASLQVVIPHGLDDMFRYNREAPLSRPQWLPSSAYILYVSFIDYYKAQIEVIQGFDIFRRESGCDVKLVLAGAEYAPYGKLLRKEIQKLGLQEHVIFAGNVPHHELPALYQYAKWNVFASECENCPNILLEALASHTPVICSQVAPMPEFARDAVQYFDAQNPDTLASAMLLLRDNPKLADDYAYRAIQYMESYQWKTTASQTWQAISGIATSVL